MTDYRACLTCKHSTTLDSAASVPPLYCQHPATRAFDATLHEWSLQSCRAARAGRNACGPQGALWEAQAELCLAYWLGLATALTLLLLVLALGGYAHGS